MIYPPQFPDYRSDEFAERKVFDAMRKLPDHFDIFYNRKFVRINEGERAEYEIDFIVVDLRQEQVKGLLCIEVKGGDLYYNPNGVWYQNGKKLDEAPDDQVNSAMRSLIVRYPEIARGVSFEWILCFPDGKCPDDKLLPTHLNSKKIIDKNTLSFLESALDANFTSMYSSNSFRNGVPYSKYNIFKAALMRGIGFALPLSERISVDDKAFLKLTNHQLELFRLVQENDNVVVKGIAGSGKTIIARSIAQEFEEQGLNVLFLCYNRILSNNIRHSLGRESKIDVSSYHSFARKYISEVDSGWWEMNSKNEDFWDLDVPAKFDEVKTHFQQDYDVVIIDEGQDFRELWFETIEYFLKPYGKFYIFMDEFQNIFNAFTKISSRRVFFQFTLPENCRNTKNIVVKLEQYLEQTIKSKEGSPEGVPVIIREYRNDVEQQTMILNEIKLLLNDKVVTPGQILLMFNADKKKSCLATVKKIEKFALESISHSTGELSNKAINYTSIKSFKGLEADIVFIIDTDKVPVMNYNVLYTQASRAKHMLYVFLKK